MSEMTMREKLARAIYDAEDPLSGDHIATVIHLSDHLFWDDQTPGDTDVEKQLEAVMIICRAAADAVLDVLAEPDEGMRMAGRNAYLLNSQVPAMADFSVSCGIIWQAMLKAARTPGAIEETGRRG